MESTFAVDERVPTGAVRLTTSAAAPSEKPDIWEILGIPDDVKNAVGYAKEAIGAVSTVVSWVGTAQKALELVGLVAAAPNPFDTLYARIQKDMKVLLTATIAGATEERLRDVAEQAAAAQTAAIHANEFILLGRPQTTFHLDRLSNADTNSLSVMNTLSKEAYWLRTYDPSPEVVHGKAIRVQDHEYFPYLTWWGQINPARPSGGLIWDYRHVLPAYLQALAARLVVLKARANNFAEFKLIATTEVNGYIAFLQVLWSRIYGAIRGKEISPPKPTDPNTPVTWPPGAGYYQSVGAVEIYTGLRDWTFFDSSRQPVLPRTWGEAYNQYVAEREASFNRLYDALGLNHLSEIIDDLREGLVDRCDVATGANVAASAGTVECIDDQPNQHVAVAGSDGGLHLLWKPDAFSGWQWHRAGSPPSSTMSSSPPVMSWFGPDGARRPYVFVSSSRFSGLGYGGVPVRKGELNTYWWTGSQWQWASQGNLTEHVMSSTPVTTSFVERGIAKMRCYVVAGNVLLANQWDGSKWEWVNLGAPPGATGQLQGGLTAVRYQWKGRMVDDVYVLAGGRLYEYTWNEDGERGWNSPPHAGVSFSGTPVAVSYQGDDGEPMVHVFVTEISGVGLHTLEWDRGWRWTPHGRPPAPPTSSAPAPFRSPPPFGVRVNRSSCSLPCSPAPARSGREESPPRGRTGARCRAATHRRSMTCSAGRPTAPTTGRGPASTSSRATATATSTPRTTASSVACG
jgi:hypothetical protein